MVKKVLITGGNGYIGSRLCLYLADVGYAVTPVCYPEVPADTFWIKKMEEIKVGDVRDIVFLHRERCKTVHPGITGHRLMTVMHRSSVKGL